MSRRDLQINAGRDDPRVAGARRAFMKSVGAAGLTALAGCSTRTDADRTTILTTTKRKTTTEKTLETQTTTDPESSTLPEDVDEIFVDINNGSATGIGTSEDPLVSIQKAIRLAKPGQTVTVASGEYIIRSPLTTIRSGTKEAPITIQGPKDAVIRPDDKDSLKHLLTLFRIRHNHIQLSGLTFDGLVPSGNEQHLGDYGTYQLILCQPSLDSDEYLRDITIKPATIGHARRALIVTKRSRNVEIGEFRVTGMAGAHYVLTGAENLHAGEIVYIGTPPTDYGKPDYYEWSEIDETSDVHVHHIDNSAGHPHSELVNTKLGTHDILVEYCTDGGGSQNTESYPPASIHFQSYDATVRWCKIHGGDGYAVHINSNSEGYLEQVDDPPITQETAGTGHAVYGNEFRNLDESTVAFTNAVLSQQKHLCGNTTDEADERLADECPPTVPRTNGIGHLGGSSPWRAD